MFIHTCEDLPLLLNCFSRLIDMAMWNTNAQRQRGIPVQILFGALTNRPEDVKGIEGLLLKEALT